MVIMKNPVGYPPGHDLTTRTRGRGLAWLRYVHWTIWSKSWRLVASFFLSTYPTAAKPQSFFTGVLKCVSDSALGKRPTSFYIPMEARLRSTGIGCLVKSLVTGIRCLMPGHQVQVQRYSQACGITRNMIRLKREKSRLDSGVMTAPGEVYK